MGGGTAVPFGGSGGNFPPGWLRRRSRKPATRPATGQNANAGGGRGQWRFPLKSAMIAGSLVLAGDTIAQLRGRLIVSKTNDENQNSNTENKDIMVVNSIRHDWLRSLRMATYGFLLYGPGSHAWYDLLDRTFAKRSLKNILVKVTLNQIVLGPCVIAIVFAWNNLWQGKLKEVPNKYREDAIPALVYGWKFWTPATVLNFWVVPLQARVAFMSCCSVFWNFYLSTTMVKS